MARVLPLPRRRDVPELLDDPGTVLTDLPANLRDIRLLNRWFGGIGAVQGHVRVLARSRTDTTLLDVATGSADIPLALLRWAGRANVALHITASDVSPEVLDEARRVVGTTPIRLTRADALQLPFPDGSFDIVICCLALHHFAPPQAERVLREMWRVSADAIVVADLRRDWIAFAGTWLATRVVARNRLTQHDGPLSVLRAYTEEELAQLARRAGIENAMIHRHPFFRMTLVARKDAHER